VVRVGSARSESEKGKLMPRTDGAVRSRRDLRQAVEAFVGSLGSSPGAIAATLAGFEVRGTPKALVVA
jgi:hypothetical protein